MPFDIAALRLRAEGYREDIHKIPNPYQHSIAHQMFREINSLIDELERLQPKPTPYVDFGPAFAEQPIMDDWCRYHI